MAEDAFFHLINEAFSYKKPLPENQFQPGQLREQGELLIQGIRKRNRSSAKYSDGMIPSNLSIYDIRRDPESFQRDIEDFIAGQAKDKYAYCLRFSHLLLFLNAVYGTAISLDFLKKFKYKDADRRRLEILKYLHEDANGKNQREIAEAFGIDEKTLREDLRVLSNGFTFMGTTLHINGHAKSGAIYNSPTHPVFLALNTTQVWSLIVGMQLLSKNTYFEHDISEIANLLYTQLSPFAGSFIEKECSKHDIPIGPVDLCFKTSAGYQKEEAKKKLCHYLRKGSCCTIRYIDADDPEKTDTIQGIPSVFIDENMSFDHIQVQSEIGRHLLKTTHILEIYGN